MKEQKKIKQHLEYDFPHRVLSISVAINITTKKGERFIIG